MVSRGQVIASEDGDFSVGERADVNKEATKEEIKKSEEFKVEIVWLNVVLISFIHVVTLYGSYLFLLGTYNWKTVVISIVLGYCTGLGITAAAHRLWAHKAYKAKLPLKIFLAVCQTMSCQNSIHEWCRDHRVHHKYTETDADPHNANRGFFFAHMGWLLTRKHPDVKNIGKNVDMSDLEADPVVMFQKRYFLPLAAFVGFILPTMLYYYIAEQDFIESFCATVWRYVVSLHFTWLVNSAAHLWSYDKPYDKTINPGENKYLATIAFGEGYHNYHHVFPWDYKTAELGIYQHNFSAAFIDMCAYFGWAYDLKSVPKNVILQRVARTGDGSYKETTSSWGWGDKDTSKDSKEATEISHPLCPKSE